MGIDDVEALEARATVEKPQKSGPANLGVRGFGKDVNVRGWRGYLVYLISFTLTYHKGVIRNDSESTLVQHMLYWLTYITSWANLTHFKSHRHQLNDTFYHC